MGNNTSRSERRRAISVGGDPPGIGSAREPLYRLAEILVVPPLKLWFNWRMEGEEQIPADGPVLVAANHISYLDPLANAYFLHRRGRRPRFLAKSELFEVPVLRTALSGSGQIPVERGTGSPAPVEAAARALNAGQAVLVYPEGTVTKDPGFMPMPAKTGVARLTLATGVPVVALASWGSQNVWQKKGMGSLKFGRPIWQKAGQPMEFAGDADDPDDLRRVADAVMAGIRHLVKDLRDRYPVRWA